MRAIVPDCPLPSDVLCGAALHSHLVSIIAPRKPWVRTRQHQAKPSKPPHAARRCGGGPARCVRMQHRRTNPPAAAPRPRPRSGTPRPSPSTPSTPSRRRAGRLSPHRALAALIHREGYPKRGEAAGGTNLLEVSQSRPYALIPESDVRSALRGTRLKAEPARGRRPRH